MQAPASGSMDSQDSALVEPSSGPGSKTWRVVISVVGMLFAVDTALGLVSGRPTVGYVEIVVDAVDESLIVTAFPRVAP